MSTEVVEQPEQDVKELHLPSSGRETTRNILNFVDNLKKTKVLIIWKWTIRKKLRSRHLQSKQLNLKIKNTNLKKNKEKLSGSKNMLMLLIWKLEMISKEKLKKSKTRYKKEKLLSSKRPMDSNKLKEICMISIGLEEMLSTLTLII